MSDEALFGVLVIAWGLIVFVCLVCEEKGWL